MEGDLHRRQPQWNMTEIAGNKQNLHFNICRSTPAKFKTNVEILKRMKTVSTAEEDINSWKSAKRICGITLVKLRFGIVTADT